MTAQPTAAVTLAQAPASSKAPASRTLADLQPGDRAVIVGVDAADKAVQRLMVLGLVEGAEIKFLRRSLGGDPLEIKLYGAAISLRREQALRFAIEPLVAAGR
ncbi:MAG TPA: FeoA family protein [Gammaproteobacteria bacterium]|nr:FeoA family protein [Gammaproteobacteria bacterium]